MGYNNDEGEKENIVFFPLNKEGLSRKRERRRDDDPLEALLNEFAPFREHPSSEGLVLERFTRGIKNSMKSDDEGEYILEQFNSIREVQARIRYYLNEIDQYL